jgi:hypothetical protein
VAETATYIYCLVERPRKPTLAPARLPPGLPGASRPELLDLGKSLWAVAADVPLDRYGADRLDAHLRDIEWVADIAVAHESMVEHFAAARGSAVVPMKLFTMFSSRARAVSDLTARRRELTAVLARIRGCVEWGVRITRRPPKPSRRAQAAPAPASGTAFLAARKRARDQAREDAVSAADAAAVAFAALSKLARESYRREAPQGATTPPLVDAVFLVNTAATARFQAAVRRLASDGRKAGIDLVMTGPWPAYNFVQQQSESA